MVHSFKFGGQRIAYDSVSGAVIPLSELAFKMLDYIELPMAKDCPSALRYDLAKFDSAAISDTYDQMYALYKEGKLFADNAADQPAEVNGAAIAIGDALITHQDTKLLELAKALADEGKNVTLSIVNAIDPESALTEEDLVPLMKEMEKLTKEQIKRARGEGGKPFTAYAPYATCVAIAKDDPVCIGCWAKKRCALMAPHGVKCDLERKRIECVMMVDTANEN